jgi:hypothetical protein
MGPEKAWIKYSSVRLDAGFYLSVFFGFFSFLHQDINQYKNYYAGDKQKDYHDPPPYRSEAGKFAHFLLFFGFFSLRYPDVNQNENHYRSDKQ